MYEENLVDKTAGDILKVLAYFDLFNYPLTVDEIRLFLCDDVEEAEMNRSLQMLLFREYIFKLKDFYSLHNNRSLADNRIKGNFRAQFLLQKAKRIARFLYYFPYVRGVGISGSLSKNFSTKNGDIDYFIITASNRLWIARTSMHLFKKLTYLAGRQHWYCMNYYIDEEALEIKEMNIFTAMETVTLLPLCGNGIFRNFFDVNDWTGIYFPNYCPDKCQKDASANHRDVCFPNYRVQMPPVKESKAKMKIKQWIEGIFNNKQGDHLDRYLMQLTTQRWKKKEERQIRNIHGNKMAIRTGRHFCKPAPEFLQKEILHRYWMKLKNLEKKYTIHLDLLL